MSNEGATKKEFWIAFVLNFVLPGVGHIYAGEVSPGVGLIVGNVLSWALIAALPITGAGVLGTWIYALIKSREVVDRYNKTLDLQAAKDQQQLANQTTPDDLVKQIGKVNQLLAAGMIDQSEFDARKAAIIQQLSMRKLVGTMDDFLLAVAPLKQAGVLSGDEVAALKRVLVAGVHQ